MVILRKFLPLTAVVTMALAGIRAEKPPYLASVLTANINKELVDYKYESNALSAHADFTDHNVLDRFERRLQSSGGSTTETTRCNFWCMLKNSIGLTIVGLLLICIR